MHRLAMYTPLQTWKKDEYPVSPFLYLSVGMHSEEQGQILLSSRLMTDSEIDEVIEQLKQELEEFRKGAKLELKSLQEKMLGK